MKFHFAISGLGTFLGKSPVTIRHWERKGILRLPRVGSNRSLTLDQIRDVARIAHQHGRISDERRNLIYESLTALGELEQEEE